MIRIATRGSELALVQANLVRRQLQGTTEERIVLEIIKTQGDRERASSFREMEGRGFFTKDIEATLLEGRADLAVHSLKDLPTETPDGLFVLPVLRRGDPRETLLVRPEAADDALPLGLRLGARVGTSAVRRHAQLRAARPDLELLDLRGNVPTRVQKVLRGELDAILIASCGLERLKLDPPSLVRRDLDPTEFVPAPGQGMLAVELRSGDRNLMALVPDLVVEEDRRAVEAERRLLGLVEGGCGLPLGAFVARTEGGYEMFAVLGPRPLPPAGLPIDLVRAHVRAADAEDLALRALEGLLREEDGRGGGDRRGELANLRILLTGTPRHVRDLARELLRRGATVLPHETAEPVYSPDPAKLREVRWRLPSFDWILFRSVTAVEMFAPILRKAGSFQGRIGAIGPATRNALLERGFPVELMPQEAVSEDLAKAFLDGPGNQGARILLPGPHEGRTVLLQSLVASGHQVTELKLYRLEKNRDRRPLPDRVDAVVFPSPSAVGAFLEEHAVPEGALVVTIGPATSEALRSRGLPADREARRHDIQGLIEALVEGFHGRSKWTQNSPA